MELRCDSICLRQRARGAWPGNRHAKDSGGPALRWPPEFSQRENFHQPRSGRSATTATQDRAKMPRCPGGALRDRGPVGMLRYNSRKSG